MRSMALEIKEFRLRYLCGFGRPERLPLEPNDLKRGARGAPELMEILDRRARFEATSSLGWGDPCEVDAVNLQELQDNMQATRDEENSTRSIRSCEEKLY